MIQTLVSRRESRKEIIHLRKFRLLCIGGSGNERGSRVLRVRAGPRRHSHRVCYCRRYCRR